MKALRAYLSLTAGQKRLLRVKTLDGSYAPATLIQTLGPLAQFDDVSDSVRPWLVGLAVVLFMMTIAVAFTNLYALPVFIAAFVACVVSYRRLKRMDISNNIRAVALPFLAVLREDMAHGELIAARLSLRPPTDSSLLSDTRDPRSDGVYHRIVDRQYADTWFSGHGELADGNRLRWAVEDRILESRRTKRNARNKTKTKVKYHKRSLLHVDLAVPANAYIIDRTPLSTGKLEVREREKRTWLRLSAVIKQRTLEPIDSSALVDLVGEAYKRLRPAGTGGTA